MKSTSTTTTTKKFNLEHAWKELRNDQKWCELSSSKPMEALKGGSVMTVHNHQALTLMKPPLLRMIKEATDHRVLRHQRAMVRRRWQRGRHCLSFGVCGASRRRIWL